MIRSLGPRRSPPIASLPWSSSGLRCACALGRHIQVDFLFRYLSPGVARGCRHGRRRPSHRRSLHLRGLPRVAVHGDRRGRDHDDDHAAEELGLQLRLRRVHPDVHSIRSGVHRELAPGLLDPRKAGGVRSCSDLIARSILSCTYSVAPMLILIGSFLALLLLGLPVALAMGVSSLLYILATGTAPDVISGPADDRRRRKLSASCRAVLHPRRQPHEHRRRHRPDLQLRRRARRLDEGRLGTGQHHRLGDLLGHVRDRHRRCRRARDDRDQGHEGPWLLDRVRRRCHRRLRDARADHPAVSALRDLRHDGQRLDRSAVSRRADPGRRHDAADDGNGRLLRPQERLGQRRAVLVEPARQARRSRSSSC